ncbi:MAG: hypothetical protein FIA96_15650 [Betaproteobacteria bacterium]|nr:hypothetical protein [Betaproteobacteria bacterium]
MLASVTTCAEAMIALEGGADIIDLKNPARGALGALDDETIRAVVAAVAGRVPVSATTGDLVDMDIGQICRAVERMANNGVDYVKVGFFPGPDSAACLDALSTYADKGIRLVAVLFGDLGYEGFPVPAFAAAGFAGVMLDTAIKGCGSIRGQIADSRLAEFVAAAQVTGMLAGLAGSLAVADIAPLIQLRPDYLGFRGALCAGGIRTGGLDAPSFARVRSAICSSGHQRSAASRPTWAATALARPSRL